MGETKSIRTIYFAGGCFWGLEAYMKRIPGVQKTCVGYANGYTENPTYEEVCYKWTGYAETVRVVYDSSICSIRMLIRAYFAVIDPTVVNRQGNDLGSQYRTGIYYEEETDLPVIREETAREQEKYRKKIVTEVMPLRCFYPAEDYHQNYLEKNPSGYCHIDLSKAKAFLKQNKKEDI